MVEITKVDLLKKEILILLKSGENERFKVDTVKHVFKNKGYTFIEFTQACNALVMENKIKSNEEEMWLNK